MKVNPLKLNGENLEIKRVSVLNVQVVYAKVTEWRLTTSASTDEVHWRMLQLGSYLVTKIEFGSLHAISTHLFHK